MSMEILINQRIYYPAFTNKELEVHLSSSNTDQIPQIDTTRVCSISTRIGAYSGWEIYHLLDECTGTEFNGFDWLFSDEDAKLLNHAIDQVLGGERQLGEIDDPEWVKDQLREMRSALKQAIEDGAETFEVLTWG